MLIKICGMTQKENISQILKLSPDFMGFIFYDKSPRNVFGMNPEIIRSLPSNITRVGVFVNSGYEEVITLVNKYSIQTVQLHGEENPEFCKKLKEKKLTVIKAIKVPQSPESNFFSNLSYFRNYVDMFLFDTAGIHPGGNGKKFQWLALEDYNLDIPFLLSGGIGPDDLERIKSFSHPQFLGIDLNSRFEISSGIKSYPLLSNFIHSIRHDQISRTEP